MPPIFHPTPSIQTFLNFGRFHVAFLPYPIPFPFRNKTFLNQTLLELQDFYLCLVNFNLIFKHCPRDALVAWGRGQTALVAVESADVPH